MTRCGVLFHRLYCVSHSLSRNQVPSLRFDPLTPLSFFSPCLLGEEEERTLTLPTVEKAAFESVVRFLRLHANTPMQDIPKVSL